MPDRKRDATKISQTNDTTASLQSVPEVQHIRELIALATLHIAHHKLREEGEERTRKCVEVCLTCAMHMWQKACSKDFRLAAKQKN